MSSTLYILSDNASLKYPKLNKNHMKASKGAQLYLKGICWGAEKYIKTIPKLKYKNKKARKNQSLLKRKTQSVQYSS